MDLPPKLFACECEGPRFSFLRMELLEDAKTKKEVVQIGTSHSLPINYTTRFTVPELVEIFSLSHDVLLALVRETKAPPKQPQPLVEGTIETPF